MNEAALHCSSRLKIGLRNGKASARLGHRRVRRCLGRGCSHFGLFDLRDLLGVVEEGVDRGPICMSDFRQDYGPRYVRRNRRRWSVSSHRLFEGWVCRLSTVPTRLAGACHSAWPRCPRTRGVLRASRSRHCLLLSPRVTGRTPAAHRKRRVLDGGRTAWQGCVGSGLCWSSGDSIPSSNVWDVLPRSGRIHL